MCVFFFSSFEQKDLDGQYFDAVDLVETAFNKLADNVVSAYLYILVLVLVQGWLHVHSCVFRKVLLNLM